VHLLLDPFSEAGGRPFLTASRRVIGLGNEWRGDDAAGLMVARRLRESPPPDADIVERDGEPLGLLDDWLGADEAIVVDAVSSGARAGVIHALDAATRELPAELFGGSTHLLGLAEAVELGRVLEQLPRRLLVVGIEGGSFAMGAGLTRPVELAVTDAARLVREQLS
jgi:hydrogenase maturation protease